MIDSQRPENRTSSHWVIAACALLIVVYGSIAWLAVSGKSPTYDEPLHTLAASIALQRGDYRLDFDNPPLWKYWAALPNLVQPLRLDTNGPQWSRLPDDIVREWRYAMHTMYQAPGNHPDQLIARSRFMMLLVAMALGAMIACWSWQLSGSIGAIAATFLFAFSPNFLAHGPLVKNDVSIALLLFALAYSLWLLGRRMTLPRLLAVGVICGAGCAVKFSGVLFPLVAVILLLSRATMPFPRFDWIGMPARRSGRVVVAAALSAVIVLITIGIIWAGYGFRFSVSPNPAEPINTQRIVSTIAHNEADVPTADAMPPFPVRAARWMLHHHLLPAPWINGLLVIRAGTLSRPSFLMGQYSDHSWPLYYPLAMLFKTPVATLVAIIAAVVIAILGRRRNSSSDAHNSEKHWAIMCVAVPPILYGLAALLTPTAVGLRHILPIYPFLFIACGWAASRIWTARLGKGFVLIVAAGLLVETLSAFPNFIPFFNVIAGGERGGLWLLSDSNLDWGQDLPLLARWQHAHPDRKLYLAYYGTADPAHYGIKYTNLPGGYELGPPIELPSSPGVIAISATILQGVFATPQVNTRAYYAPYRTMKPMAVLGGSIYLFNYPGTDAPQ